MEVKAYTLKDVMNGLMAATEENSLDSRNDATAKANVLL